MNYLLHIHNQNELCVSCHWTVMWINFSSVIRIYSCESNGFNYICMYLFLQYVPAENKLCAMLKKISFCTLSVPGRFWDDTLQFCFDLCELEAISCYLMGALVFRCDAERLNTSWRKSVQTFTNILPLLKVNTWVTYRATCVCAGPQAADGGPSAAV